jgi:hypothetical protein
MEHYIFEVLKHIYNNLNSKATYLDDKYKWNYIYYNISYKKIMWNTGHDFILTDKFLTSTKIDWNFGVFDVKQHEIQQELLKYVNLQLNENFDKFEEIRWYTIYEYETLTEEFIEKTMHCLDFEDRWEYIFKYNSLSEEFIRKHCKNFDKNIWSYITTYQTLSEEFITEYQNYVDWYDISYYQKFDVDFALKFQKRLTWAAVIRRKMLPFDFYVKNIDIIKGDDISELLIYYPKFATMFRDYVKSLN